MLPIEIRPVQQGDQAFVLDGWIRSWRTSPWAGCVPNNRVWEVTRDAIAGLALRGAQIDVAVARGTDVERLVGFIAYERPDVIHYVFVKRRGFRGLGIGAQLVQHATQSLGLAEPGRFSHRTHASKFLLDYGWTWDPIPSRIATIAPEVIDSSENEVNHGPSEA